MSLVLELQKVARDQSIPVSKLLRTALVVASKLNLSEFKKWIELELKGYEEQRVPDYRVVQGTVMAADPYHRWIPVRFATPEISVKMSKGAVGESVGEIEHLLSRPESGSLQLPYPAKATSIYKGSN